MESVVYRVQVAAKDGRGDGRALALVEDCLNLGIDGVRDIQVCDLFFLEADRKPSVESTIERLCSAVLFDPVVQDGQWQDILRTTTDESWSSLRPAKSELWVVEVAFRPGVTDNAATQIVRASHELGLSGITAAASGQRYEITGDLTEDQVRLIAQRLLCNDVIQRHALGHIYPIFPHLAQGQAHVQLIRLMDATDDSLIALSKERRLALDLTEMRAIQAYFRTAGRPPTDAELETLAQTWSEHCIHKTFRAEINWGGDTIDGLLRTYIRGATEAIEAGWVRSAFVDNAGVIEFDSDYEVSFKVETHNHPSAIEPFGGANTGVGGVVRDILGVSHRPIAVTDILCFGPQDLLFSDLPAGVLHPRRVQRGVVAGVQDYGNKLGLPTVSGAIFYDAGYTTNPLVFCGCVGIGPKGVRPRQPLPGHRVIVIGGRTGRDGLRGATFSSLVMDATVGEVAGASVQIGDPLTEKGVIEVVIGARDQGLYSAITDCGAGGLSSAVGELGGETGVDVDLASVRLKYPGLAPWEVWLSEAQERMVLAVPPAQVPPLQALCDRFDVELTDIGQFTDTGRLVVRYGSVSVVDLDMRFVHEGMPRRRLTASPPISAPRIQPHGQSEAPRAPRHFKAALLRLLSHPDTASKEAVIRLYDHEVQGGTVVKPLVGARDDGPSDAAVIKPAGTRGSEALVIACGGAPEVGKMDAYSMAVSAVDEAIRNAVAVGADPDRIALLDNFCWGDPNQPEILGSLVEAARGCYYAAVGYGTPFICGKDSLNNEYMVGDRRVAVPGTLIISAVGLMPDLRQAVTMDLKAPGDLLYVLGLTRNELAGSHYRMAPGGDVGSSAAPSLPLRGRATMRALHRAIRAGLVRACHDCSEGGLAVSLAEMCIAGRLGCLVDLSCAPAEGAGAGMDPEAILFSESNGRFVVEVAAEAARAFEREFQGLPCAAVGQVTLRDVELNWQDDGTEALTAGVDELVQAWKESAQ